jgi:hypothetical protein
MPSLHERGNTSSQRLGAVLAQMGPPGTATCAHVGGGGDCGGGQD